MVGWPGGVNSHLWPIFEAANVHGMELRAGSGGDGGGAGDGDLLNVVRARASRSAAHSQCTVHSVQCTVHSALCTLHSLTHCHEPRVVRALRSG